MLGADGIVPSIVLFMTLENRSGKPEVDVLVVFIAVEVCEINVEFEISLDNCVKLKIPFDPLKDVPSIVEEIGDAVNCCSDEPIVSAMDGNNDGVLVFTEVKLAPMEGVLGLAVSSYKQEEIEYKYVPRMKRREEVNMSSFGL